MKKFPSLAIFFILLSGCSSSTVETGSKTNASNNSIVNSPNANARANTANFSDTNKQIFSANSYAAKNEKGKVTNVPPIPANAMKTSSPAPDNSVISSTMNNKGEPVETRTFKNHPILLKVEKVFVDIKNPNTRVYLKNGKIIELPQGKINNASTVSADEILRAVGIAPQKNVPTKKEDE